MTPRQQIKDALFGRLQSLAQTVSLCSISIKRLRIPKPKTSVNQSSSFLLLTHLDDDLTALTENVFGVWNGKRQPRISLGVSYVNFAQETATPAARRHLLMGQ